MVFIFKIIVYLQSKWYKNEGKFNRFGQIYQKKAQAQ